LVESDDYEVTRYESAINRPYCHETIGRQAWLYGYIFKRAVVAPLDTR
jgi:hypothetical protein